MKTANLLLIGALSVASLAALADERAEYPSTQPATSTLTGAQVRAELAAAIKAGGVRYGQLDCTPATVTQMPEREEMKSDAAAARASWLRAGELG
jgi:hypothetical protein